MEQHHLNPWELSTLIYLAVWGTTVVYSEAAIAKKPQAAGADYLFITTSDWHDCQQIGREYREVYAFETASFYVNICQNGDRLATNLPKLNTQENLLFKQNLHQTYTFWQKPLDSNSRFDFYTIEGKLHFLATCS